MEADVRAALPHHDLTSRKLESLSSLGSVEHFEDGTIVSTRTIGGLRRLDRGLVAWHVRNGTTVGSDG
jgi:hypothetical protein